MTVDGFSNSRLNAISKSRIKPIRTGFRKGGEHETT